MTTDNRKRTLLGIGAVLVLASVFAIALAPIASLFNFIPMRLSAITLSFLIVDILIILICRIDKQPITSLGFQKGNYLAQIAIGIGLFITLSALFIGVPLIVGVSRDNLLPRAQPLWWDIPNKILMVGVTEELLFRGYLMGRIKDLTNSKAAAIAISSALFGLWHYLSAGNIIQVLMTAIIGACFAIPMMKIKHCSIVSVALAHGLYDLLLGILAWIYQ